MRPRSSALQRELQQRRPFANAREEGTIAVLRTADILRTRIEAFMRPYGITGQQYNVLRILRGAGAPVPTLVIADRMIEHAPGITRLIDRLEAKRLVRRERSPDDRRQVLCTITPAGRELLRKIDDPLREIETSGMGKLTDEQVSQLVRLLDGVREGT